MYTRSKNLCKGTITDQRSDGNGSAWVDVAAPVDVPARGCLGVDCDGRHVALYRLGGAYYATSNVCSHQFALLSEGSVDGEYIECPMHQGRFHIPTGAAQGVPVTAPIAVYPVKVERERVYVQLDAGGG